MWDDVYSSMDKSGPDNAFLLDLYFPNSRCCVTGTDNSKMIYIVKNVCS